MNKKDVRKNVTINMRVCNEAPQIWYALMSTLPFVEHAVIVDAGSTDDTPYLLKDIQKRFPFVEIFTKDHANLNAWTIGKTLVRSAKLTEMRNFLVKKTKTKWIWLQDGDEIYTESAAKNLLETMEVMGEDIEVIFVPFLWFSKDLTHIAIFPEKHHYGRMFRTNDLHFGGAFPGEYTYYKEDLLRRPQLPGEPKTFTIPHIRGNEMYHYEMVVKPWRRTVEEVKEFHGRQPEVFSLKKALFDKALEKDGFKEVEDD